MSEGTEDERFARCLQLKFDREAAALAEQELQDNALAQTIANNSHQISEDEDDCNSINDMAQDIVIKKSEVPYKTVQTNVKPKMREPPKPNENLNSESCKTKYLLNSNHPGLTNQSKLITEPSNKSLGSSDSDMHPKSSVISTSSDKFVKKDSKVNKVRENPSRSLIDHSESCRTLQRSQCDSTSITQSPLSKNDNHVQTLLPLCKYGKDCYRKNSVHLREYRHTVSEDPEGETPMKNKNVSLKRSLTDDSPSCSSSRGNNLKRSAVSPSCSSSSRGNTLKRSAVSPSCSSSSQKNSALSPPTKKLKPIEKKDKLLSRETSNINSNNATGSSWKEKDPLRVPKGKSRGFGERVLSSGPYGVFLTKSVSLTGTYKDPLGCVLPDLLHPSMGNIVETAQFSFLVNADFLHSMYEGVRAADKPLLVLYGELEGDHSKFPKGNFVKVKMPYLYGTHHTKMMLLLYDAGMRVVVHTANMRPDDWFEKTQGVWVSPVLPRIDPPGSSSPSDSPTQFRADLLRYLQSYKLGVLGRWTTVIRAHDFSGVRAVFLGHVPGYHRGPELRQWGHLSLRRWLARHTTDANWRSAHLNVGDTVLQCSSIGSLGKDCTTWVTTELGRSLGGGVECPQRKLKVVYPTESTIRTSSQGWSGGSCLPYTSTTHAKQPWLQQHLNDWRAGVRTQAAPHIKTYTRLNSDHSAAQYFVLTSANLSKAAWGQLQKQGEQLFIRSYEAGVLLLPKFVTGESSFPLSPSAPHPLPLPFDLPLTPYPPEARPWFMDTKKKDKDINGNTYP